MYVVAVCAVKNEPSLELFERAVGSYVDAIIIADESEGPIYGGGIGPSLVWAWGQALDMGADRIVQIDAGGSHHPHQIPRLIDSDADLVIGSRFIPGATYEGRPWRAWASYAYGQYHAYRRDSALMDWTSGFRCFTPEAAKHLAGEHYKAKMHGWQAEVLHRALDAGLSVEEVPITYTAGDSSFLRARNVWEAVKVR